jgi:hypothetical protein
MIPIIENLQRDDKVMINSYEVPEVLEIGRTQDVILGSPKWVWFLFDDSPCAIPRMIEVEEDE